MSEPQSVDDTLFGESDNYLQKQGLDISGGLKDLLILFLREFFSQQPEYTWREDPHATDIVIVDHFPSDEESVQEYPRIVVNRGTVRKTNITMGDIKEPILAATDEQGLKMSDMLSATVRFQCAAKEGVEAGRIATMVFVAILVFRRVLYRQGMHEVRNLQLGQEANLERDSEIVAQVVPVTLQCNLQYDWIIQRDAPTHKQIDGSLQLDDDGVVGQDFTVRSDIQVSDVDSGPSQST